MARPLLANVVNTGNQDDIMFKVPNAVAAYIAATRIAKRHRSEISKARCCEFTGPARKPKRQNSKIRKYDALNRVLLS